MRLHENQLKLIRHLAQFNLLDYASCLHLLDTEGTGDHVALSYAFRPLTKNKYLTKRKDGSVSILAKGRALFPNIKPLISAGGGEQSIQRVMEVSRMAVLMEEHGILAVAEVPESRQPVFIPSACWRNIAPGILSTTRFTGMVLAGKEKLAVYDIGDGSMEWQVRAEGSLFYTRYGSYETKATGMILICEDGKRNKTAKNIIRQTMWSRRQLLSDICLERNKPTCWSRSPIKLRAQYEHVYFTTPRWFQIDIQAILGSESEVCDRSKNETRSHDPAQGDYEKWPYRFFVNPATDLLKYVYFFSAVKELKKLLESDVPAPPEVRYAICYRKRDRPILRMYPDVVELEGIQFFEYLTEENDSSN